MTIDIMSTIPTGWGGFAFRWAYEQTVSWHPTSSCHHRTRGLSYGTAPAVEEPDEDIIKLTAAVTINSYHIYI